MPASAVPSVGRVQRSWCPILPTRKFTYGRLNWASNEMRLVRILPNNSDTTSSDIAPIACSIINAPLEDAPPYIALSYAWEETALIKPLLLDDRLTYVTASLDAALRQIRKLQTTDGSFRSISHFWVDAICINQDDDIEKGWQVQKMSDIFRKAEYALVWLGQSSENSDVAMRVLHHVGSTSSSVLDHRHRFDDWTPTTFKIISNLDDNFVSSLTSLLSRPWWRRVWAVQEFASAKDIVFLCGDSRLPWYPCFRALSTIERLKRVTADKGWQGTIGAQLFHQYKQVMAEISLLTGVLRLFTIRRALNQDGHKFSLWKLLTLKRFGMQATDYRDIVYGLTGIAKDSSEKRLYPDYTKDVKEVYTDLAKSFLVEGRLRTLWLCSHPRSIPDLPTWVPDWSSVWRTDRRYLSGNAGYGSSQNVFAASRKMRPIISFSSHNALTLLHLEGLRFDTVRSITGAFDLDRVLAQSGFLRAHLALESRFQAFRALNRSSRRSDWDALIRCTLADMELVRGSDVHFSYCRSTRKSRRELYNSFLASNGDYALGIPRSIPASWLDILYRHNGRRPFVTRNGYLGLGPVEMRRGDVVAVIYGSEVPLILRKAAEGNYKVVGEAYVDGIMDGEALDMHLPRSTFSLL